MHTPSSIPERIKTLQTCYYWYQGCEPPPHLAPLFAPDQMLIVTCPESCPKLVERFREAGGLVLLYVSIYKVPMIGAVPDDWRDWRGGSPFRSALQSSAFWQHLDATAHPEWILRDPQGHSRRPFELNDYMAGWYQTSPAAAGYADAVRNGIQAVARDGRFSGVFIDNIHPSSTPAAVQGQGGLVPLDAADHAEAFFSLLERMRAWGMEARDRYFYVQTNGSQSLRIQNLADFMCLESFVYSFAHPGRSISDKEARRRLAGYAPLRQRGGRTIILSYYGFSGHDIADDARSMRALADETDSLFADFLTMADPETIAPSARRYARSFPDNDKPRLALANLRPGSPEAAREVYRLSKSDRSAGSAASPRTGEKPHVPAASP